MTTRAFGFSYFARVLGYVSALPLALIVVLTFSDVFARYVFAHPIPGASEIIQFAMAMAIFTALPLVTQAGGHITVDLFTSGVSNRRKACLQVPAELLSGVALAVIAWRLWVQAGEYAGNNTATIVLNLNMAPLAYAMSIFSAVSVVVAGVRTIEALRAIATPTEVPQ